MACCKENIVDLGKNCQQTEELKSQLMGMGFDVQTVTDFVKNYGDDVLALVVEALRLGFTKEFVNEALSKIGPIVLELVVNFMNSKRMSSQKFAAVAGDQSLVIGEEIRLLDASFVETMVDKLLPLVLEKYGDKLVQMFVEMALKFLAERLK